MKEGNTHNLSEVARAAAIDRADVARSRYPNVDVLSVFNPRADFLRRSGVQASQRPKTVIASEEADLIAEGRVVKIEEKIVSLGLELGDNPRAKESRELLKDLFLQDVSRSHIVIPPVR